MNKIDAVNDLFTLITLIKQQPLFSQLTDQEVDELALLFIEKKISPDDVIVKQGDEVDSFYLIVQGEADVRVGTVKEGKVEYSSVATLHDGDAIGLNETGFYSLSGKRTATVVAITNMVLYQMSVAAFHGFALSHTHVSEIMHKQTEKLMNSESS